MNQCIPGPLAVAGRKGALLLFCGSFALAYLSPLHAFADGAAGWSDYLGDGGGNGGTGYAGAPGGEGSADSLIPYGRGGGGGAAGGGSGGTGGGEYAGLGGAGGTSGGPSGFTLDLAYTTDDVDLTVDSIAPSDATVYTALDSEALLRAQASSQALLNRLDGLSGQGSALEPATLASPGQAGSLVGSEATGLDTLFPTLPDSNTRVGGWLRAVNSQDTVTGDGAAPGYSASSAGFLAGMDARLASDCVAGLAVGDDYTSVNQADGESGSVDSPNLSLYGSADWGRVRLDGSLGMSFDTITASRPITGLDEGVTSSHGGTGLSGALQAGLPLETAGVDLLPKVGVAYAQLSEGGFAETGVPGFDLAVDPQATRSLKPYVGLGASKGFQVGGLVLSPEADLGFSEEVLENDAQDTVQVGEGSFTEDGIAPARAQVSVGGGLGVKLARRLAVYMDYHAILPSGNLAEQVVSGGLRWQFGRD